MPSVLQSKLLTCENVPQVGSAVGALDLGTHAVGIREPFYCSGDFVIEAWPTAACFKLVFGSIKFGAAPFTYIGSLFPESIVFACKGHLGAFVDDYLFLFRRQLH